MVKQRRVYVIPCQIDTAQQCFWKMYSEHLLLTNVLTDRYTFYTQNSGIVPVSVLVNLLLVERMFY